MTRFLHVANGTSTTMTLREAGVTGTFSIWADPLYDGPVPGGIDDETLIDVRSRHLAASSGRLQLRDSDSASPTPDPVLTHDDPVNDMRAWRRVIADHGAYDELVLWYEHDLFCQLNLVQLLTWIRAHVPESALVSLVCIDRFPGRPHFKGLGELTAGELAPLLDTRRAVTPGQFALARRAWQAFREPTPETLDALRRADTSALPFLAAAVERFLQEYPWTTDGLSRSERRLLELAIAEEGRTLGSVFVPMSDGDREYHMTDLSLLALARRFSDAVPPLLMLSAPGGGGINPFTRLVHPTEQGRRVLTGEIDRVAKCGIDVWLGGVHLTGHAVPWRWDPEAGAIRRMA
jgi:hypothetical protein